MGASPLSSAIQCRLNQPVARCDRGKFWELQGRISRVKLRPDSTHPRFGALASNTDGLCALHLVKRRQQTDARHPQQGAAIAARGAKVDCGQPHQVTPGQYVPVQGPFELAGNEEARS
ncbi:protein of unknown function (plasmid) [Cupriavidus taiwanensis]|uniref:Uncharacterized protein n=1 Tax=Cupriavidus taiwanensis TaxID=164546 RepID=A0A375IUD3_9BURK|nr:protein of unknown function [Cupriavidus taiwanensis]